MPEAWGQDYDFHRTRWTPGTCEWILRDAAFQEWLDDIDDRPRVLWMYGAAGCGKSVLSSFLIEHITNELKYPCQYFFVRFQDIKKRSLNLLLRVLALQLAQKLPSYANRLRQLRTATPDLRTVDSRNLWNLLFKQTFFKLDIPVPVYWIVDGVDEAESPDAFLKLLQDVHKLELPLRIAIVSRKQHDISTAFARLGKFGIKTGSTFVESRPTDLKAFIIQELEIEQAPTYVNMVTQQLLLRAKSNFLWLHFAVDRINKCLTTLAIQEALEDLPTGMEDFYDRMAASVQTQHSESDRGAGMKILEWVVCAQRPLNIAELSDALENVEVLHLQSSIESLCGGFLVIDKDGKVTIIHETAREYLTRKVSTKDRLAIHEQATNTMLLKRCMTKLNEPNLRAQIATGMQPALLEYAASCWFMHLTRGSCTEPHIVKDVAKFFESYHVLDWIYVVAQSGRLSVLIQASQQLTSMLSEINGSVQKPDADDVNLIGLWMTDLAKIVGKFGANLREDPESIYTRIPPFCPEGSAIHNQFGWNERGLQVTVGSHGGWDDSMGRFSLDDGASASQILTTGNRVLIMANVRSTGYVYVYNSITFEEQRRIRHSERLQAIQISRMGDRIVGYGHKTTVIWELGSGNQIKKAKNPAKFARPHTLCFTDDDSKVVVGNEDRSVLCLSLNDDATEWEFVSKIVEEPLEGYVVNMPWYSALSPDGTMIAYAYR